MTRTEIEAALKRVSFRPSCIDMGWEWEVREVFDVDHCTAGFELRTTFQRPDTNTGKVAKGFGRWWHMPHDIRIDGVIKTAFAACELILKHELMEAFLYNEDRIFNPHHNLHDLCAAVRSFEAVTPVLAALATVEEIKRDD